MQVNYWYMKMPLNIWIQRAIEHGFTKYFAQKSKRILKIFDFYENLVETDFEINQAAVTIENVSFAVYIFAVGSILSIIVLVGEIFITLF